MDKTKGQKILVEAISIFYETRESLQRDYYLLENKSYSFKTILQGLNQLLTTFRDCLMEVGVKLERVHRTSSNGNVLAESLLDHLFKMMEDRNLYRKDSIDTLVVDKIISKSQQFTFTVKNTAISREGYSILGFVLPSSQQTNQNDTESIHTVGNLVDHMINYLERLQTCIKWHFQPMGYDFQAIQKEFDEPPPHETVKVNP